MNEMSHQDRLAAAMSDGFRTFAAEMEKRLPGRSDIFALYDDDGRYIRHEQLNGEMPGTGPRLTLPESFLYGLSDSAVFSASRRERNARTGQQDLPPTCPQAGTCLLGVIPVITEDEEVLYLAQLSESASFDAASAAAFLEVAGMALETLLRAARAEATALVWQRRLEELELATIRQEALFAMCMRINTHNDADQVLTELMRIVDELMPDYRFEIYVSHDQYRPMASVKPLAFRQSEEDGLFRAFTEGRPIVSMDGDGKPAEAFFPLRGKQGVYGVIRMEMSDGQSDPATDRDMAMLAETAGSALENARLYEQSNRLVSELRLINEITQRLNQSLKLQDIFHFASAELRQIFAAQFCCMMELVEETDELVVRASEPDSFMGTRYPADYGIGGHVASTKEPVIISDYGADRSIPSVWTESTDSRSLLASPVLVEGRVVGVILIAHREANYFSYENYKLLQTLSGHIGLAVSNASLHAEVRKMVQTDRLTGLFARHYLDEQISGRQKKDYCGSLIVVDIDDFKKVNDTHGHQVGDRVLIQVSSVIRSCIREGDIASRWGGEELAVYLAQATKDQASKVAERIRVRVNAETSPQVSVSCGVSDWSWEDDRISVESLFYRADMALYKAKHSGKNRIFTD
ncbi:diguanylate cyclase domain-containing protein [Paenibacillus hodogayensis]|uniref:Diguanylate cyclase domain-containing protein n=1 Tax=Paenibacillus hodogayensis TaxID=279208 RepID=A0ABV5VPD2_9BACL